MLPRYCLRRATLLLPCQYLIALIDKGSGLLPALIEFCDDRVERIRWNEVLCDDLLIKQNSTGIVT
jgi:hypothetical protein